MSDDPRQARSAGAAHDRLRATTQNLHDLVNSRFEAPALSERATYVKYLLMNWPCTAIEPALTNAGIHFLLPDWSQRERRFALMADLRDFGVRPKRHAACNIDADTGTILGWAYVLEGSRRGAPFVLQAVERSDDPVVCAATRFLRHGDSRKLWSSFKTALAQIDDDPAATSRACAAAMAGFTCFLAS